MYIQSLEKCLGLNYDDQARLKQDIVDGIEDSNVDESVRSDQQQEDVSVTSVSSMTHRKTKSKLSNFNLRVVIFELC